MPLKRQAVRKIASKRLTEECSRRNQVREDSSSSDDDEVLYFQSQEASTLFDDVFRKKSVIFGKCIHAMNLFQSHGFLEPFENQRWMPLITLNLPVYPILIRMFFANATIEERYSTVHSFVKGKHITLNESTISQIFDIPREGTRTTVFRTWSLHPFTALRQTQAVLDDMSVTRASRPSSKTIPVPHRIMHHILSHDIIPRDGHRDHITFQDMCVMTHLILRTPFNLPHLMMWQIIDAHKRRTSLPYGILFTRIFQHFDVDLSGEELRALRHPHDFYTSVTLGKMHLRLHHGRYIRSEELSESDSDADSDEDDVPPHTEAGPSAPAPSPAHHAPPSAPEPGTSAAHVDAPFRSGATGSYRSLRQEIFELRQEMTTMRQEFSSQLSDMRQESRASIDHVSQQLTGIMDLLRQRSP